MRGPGSVVAAHKSWVFAQVETVLVPLSRRKFVSMIGILIAVLLAALVYWLCMAIGLPAIVAIIAAVLVLLSGVGTGGYGYGRRGI
jgi:hypothetical protein